MSTLKMLSGGAAASRVLPKEFELATDYTLGACTQTTQPVLAQTFAAWPTGAQSEHERRQGGFEFKSDGNLLKVCCNQHDQALITKIIKLI